MLESEANASSMDATQKMVSDVNSQKENRSSRKRSCLWALGCGCLLFACAGLAALVLIIAGITEAGKAAASIQGSKLDVKTNPLKSDSYPAPGTGNRIAVIDIRGVIANGGGNSMFSSEICDSATIVELLENAAENPDVKGIIVRLNTPGGEVIAADDIYMKIKNIRSHSRKPVVALMESMAASGGYYVAAGCDKIIANRMTLTGSIGVIISTYNISGLVDLIGIENEVYKSGEMKDMLNPMRDRTDAEKKLVNDLVMECYGEFVKIVAGARKKKIEEVSSAPVGDGRVWSGKQALEMGMVDSLGGMKDAVAEMEKLTQSPNGSLAPVTYTFRRNFFDELFGAAAERQTVEVKVPGAASGRFSMRSGCPYFLYGVTR